MDIWLGHIIGTKSGLKTITTVIKEIAETATYTIHIHEINNRVTFELGHDSRRYNYCTYLNKFGLSYDKESGLW